MLRSPVAHEVNVPTRVVFVVMLMVVIVSVVVLLTWAVGSSVPAAWSSAEVGPTRRRWRQVLSSGAVMVSFFLDPTSPEHVPGAGRDDGAVRSEKVPDVVPSAVAGRQGATQLRHGVLDMRRPAGGEGEQLSGFELGELLTSVESNR